MRWASSSRSASTSTRANVPRSSPGVQSRSVINCRAKTVLPAPRMATFGIGGWRLEVRTEDSGDAVRGCVVRGQDLGQFVCHLDLQLAQFQGLEAEARACVCPAESVTSAQPESQRVTPAGQRQRRLGRDRRGAESPPPPGVRTSSSPADRPRRRSPGRRSRSQCRCRCRCCRANSQPWGVLRKLPLTYSCLRMKFGIAATAHLLKNNGFAE